VSITWTGFSEKLRFEESENGEGVVVFGMRRVWK